MVKNISQGQATAIAARYKNIDPKACFCCGKTKRTMYCETIRVSVWESVNYHLCFQCEKSGRWFNELMQNSAMQRPGTEMFS